MRRITSRNTHAHLSRVKSRFANRENGMPPMGRLKVKVNPAAIWSPVAALSRKLTTHLTSLYAIVFFTQFLLSRRTPVEALCRKKLIERDEIDVDIVS